MTLDIKTWKEMACFYGSAFDLREERVLGVRLTKDCYELYYRDEQEKIRFLYIETDAFENFYSMLEQDGWENILITKYINPKNKAPFFLLKCAKDGYSVSYHYEISQHILIDADILFKGEVTFSLEKMSLSMKNAIKKVHTLVLGYTRARFKENVQNGDKLNNLIGQLNITNTHVIDSLTKENAKMIRESIDQIFYYSVIELKKNQEYAVNSILSIHKKQFDSAVTSIIMWLSLVELVTSYSEEKQESKDELINWLNSRYQMAKKELTKYEVEQLLKHGVKLF